MMHLGPALLLMSQYAVYLDVHECFEVSNLTWE